MTTGNNMQANAPWETQLSISTACDQFDLASIEALTKQAVHDLPALMAAQDPRAARMIRTLMGSMKGLVVATDGPRRRKAERAVALIAPYLMDMANEWANDGDVEYGAAVRDGAAGLLRHRARRGCGVLHGPALL
jgi:hypothetical protein